MMESMEVEVMGRREARVKAGGAYHFVGIGGCGMSGLAQVLAMRGVQVTGSDMATSGVIERLGRRGIAVRIGHDGGQMPEGVDCVVVSAAIKESNPELKWAREHGVRVCKYAELLGELSREMRTLAVAGTHGKSTSSGWLAYVLKQGGVDTSFVVGAEVEQLGGGSGAGQSEYLVVEACEYDRSFLNLRPAVAGVLNVEADHLDYYRDLEEIVGAFGEFMGLVGEEGLVVVNGEDENALRAVGRLGRKGRCETFGLKGRADWGVRGLRYEQGKGRYELVYGQEAMGEVALSLAGEHNVKNSLAVAAMAKEAGVEAGVLCEGLSSYVGVGRRMSYKGEGGGVVVLDDYAHHPTEIQATLGAIAAQYEPRRLWCVFQPHQHSRTRFLLSEFALSFGSADVVLLPDIYFVRDSEQSRREITAAMLAERIQANGGDARYLGDFGRIVECLCREVKAGDVVVTMGAGDVWKLADELVCRFGKDCVV